MKQTTRMIGLLVLVVFAATMVSAQEQASPVEIELLSYQPIPAQPGDILDVYLQVSNNAAETVEDVEIELEASQALTPEGRSVVTVDRIPAWSSYTARFQVRVSADAGSGDRVLTVLTRQQDVPEQRHTVTIAIASDEASLALVQVQTDPASLLPGQDAQVSVTVENQDTSLLRNIRMELDLEESPFVPIGSSTRKTVASLGGQRSTQVDYTLAVDPDATASIYRIPVQITFLDEQGEERTIEDTLGLRVNTQDDTKAYLDEVTRNSDGSVQVAIRVVNKGLSEIKFMELAAGDGDGFDVHAADRQVYVGNVDSDDWETIRLTIDTTAETFSLPITYTYRDTYNELHTNEDIFTVDVPAQQQNSAVGPIIWIVILAVVVVGIIWWRRRRKANT